ncbi:efflux RND transporter permease subunit [Paraliomyxa miuraensis]|uniref:efflux RND transporter permease subunit n=1 Tax=Paraliomyxa miuraensis TaxID=376150 RepID=UPI002252C2D8|nr:efflux RND transporter permease subunit [Paraliomyxa miuraensis]MCX4247000.1 efflux RND transporter permease subunit [Paraliomyxa miuraensis]
MRGFIAATVVHPVTTTMITVAVLVFGLVAATRLPVELLPDLSYPTITIQTNDADAAPAEIEELITRPIEERVGAVPGVIRVESSSREGLSEVILDFEWGTAVDHAMADVREKLDRVQLPQTAERPVVLRYDPSAEPVMRLALRGPAGAGALSDRDLATLRQQADRIVKRQLEKLPGVAAVQLHGGEEEEVLVELDPARIAALGLTTEEVAEAIRRSNVNQPGGAISEGHRRWLIRTLHESRTPEQLAQTIIRSAAGAELRLHQVASVHRVPTEREELALVDDHEAVELAVYREGDANIVAVAQALREALPRLPLPAGHEVVVLSNRAEFIEAAVREVQGNTLVGGALAVLVLLFFLRELRATVVIAVAIPISLLATFIPLSALDVSLNVMSLGGLALGVGMLVDNSIVVLESIARVRERGLEEHARTGSPVPPRRVAAIEGTAEVASSVVASTLTTVAVFFPMSFVEGVAGQLVRDLSYAVSFSMLSSMAISLTLVPVLQAIGDRADEDAESGRPRSWLAWLLGGALALVAWPLALLLRVAGSLLGLLSRPLTFAYDQLERTYGPILRVALRVRWLVIAGAVVACVASIRLLEDRGRTLLPEVAQGELFVQVRLPQGTSLPRTTATMQVLSRALADDPDVELRFARIGSITQAGSAAGSLVAPHLGQLDIHLPPEAIVRQDEIEARIMDVLRAACPEPEASDAAGTSRARPEPATVLQLGRPSLFSFAPPIELQVFGEDPERVTAHVQRLLPALAEVEGLRDLLPDDLEGRPEVRVRFDHERLGRLGLSVDTAATAVQRAIQGEVVSTLYAPDEQLDIRVRLPEVDRRSVEDVARVQVTVNPAAGGSAGVPVRLDAVAVVEAGRGPAEIRRIDGRRGLRIQARSEGVDLGGLADRVQLVIDEHASEDPEVEAMLSGQANEMELSLRSLMLTTALSVFLVYVVMASSFESLLHPFLIMFTVPLALAGVSLAAWITDLPLSAMVGIGVIVLGGIVVNNAIVLINAVNDRRGEGMDVDAALVDAGRVRIRPIVMTTLTTVLGLLPMALGVGEGAALRQPLAVAVIGGLSFATILTLLVMPCAYRIVPGRVREAWKRP